MSRVSIRSIARAHHGSFIDDDKGAFRTMLELYGWAAATVVALLVLRRVSPAAVDLDNSVGEPATAGLALLAGLLFALGVTVLEKAIEMDQGTPEPSAVTTLDAKRLQGLSANALFTSILAGSGTAALIGASLFPSVSWALTVTAMGLVVAVGASGLKVCARVFAETKNRTDRARTGVSRDRAHGSSSTASQSEDQPNGRS